MGVTKIRPPSSVALDTCILLSLADHQRQAWAAIKAIRVSLKPVVFFLTPTVLQELVAHLKSSSPERRRLAESTFAQLRARAWPDFTVCDFVSVGHGIVEQIGKELRRRDILPDEEVNDSLIMGEVALRNCAFFLTEDKHYLQMDVPRLHATISSFDLDPPTILSCNTAMRL